ncbi:hypothetical protein Alsa3_CDS0179 [Staphylococcus phage Alsa_3]|nr:hypothetical protein Alsa3_CDS0179 [Staphylococcus phage Alsa_3]WNM51304.1 hypothetical protein Alsa4_CDS0174 [Staphylococcus phage Alsa_4]
MKYLTLLNRLAEKDFKNKIDFIYSTNGSMINFTFFNKHSRNIIVKRKGLLDKGYYIYSDFNSRYDKPIKVNDKPINTQPYLADKIVSFLEYYEYYDFVDKVGRSKPTRRFINLETIKGTAGTLELEYEYKSVASKYTEYNIDSDYDSLILRDTKTGAIGVKPVKDLNVDLILESEQELRKEFKKVNAQEYYSRQMNKLETFLSSEHFENNLKYSDFESTYSNDYYTIKVIVQRPGCSNDYKDFSIIFCARHNLTGNNMGTTYKNYIDFELGYKEIKNELDNDTKVGYIDLLESYGYTYSLESVSNTRFVFMKDTGNKQHTFVVDTSKENLSYLVITNKNNANDSSTKEFKDYGEIRDYLVSEPGYGHRPKLTTQEMIRELEKQGYKVY